MTYLDEHVVYVDTETTGLDPERHEVWDIALIDGATGREYIFHPPVSLATADSNALRITNYHQRVSEDKWAWTDPRDAAKYVALVTSGKHIVGAVPSFDAAFLERLVRKHGHAPAWHYHLIDIEALAAGYLGMKPPWDSDELNERLGLPPAIDKHTAIADARWARDVYEKVLYERSTP